MAIDSEALYLEYIEKFAYFTNMLMEGSRKPEPKWMSTRPLERFDFDFDANLDKLDGYGADECQLLLNMLDKETTGEMCMIAPDKNNTENTDNENEFKVEEAKADGSKQMDIGSTGIVRSSF